MVRHIADIGSRDADLAGQLTLNGRVELVGQWPLIALVNRFHACRGKEAGTRWTEGVGEGVSIGERGGIPVDVGERCDGAEYLTHSEGLCSRWLIPFVPAHAAIEDSRTRADRRLSVSKRIPRDSDTRGEMV